jgi:hypothetical protein
MVVPGRRLWLCCSQPNLEANGGSDSALPSALPGRLARPVCRRKLTQPIRTGGPRRLVTGLMAQKRRLARIRAAGRHVAAASQTP